MNFFIKYFLAWPFNRKRDSLAETKDTFACPPRAIPNPSMLRNIFSNYNAEWFNCIELSISKNLGYFYNIMHVAAWKGQKWNPVNLDITDILSLGVLLSESSETALMIHIFFWSKDSIPILLRLHRRTKSFLLEIFRLLGFTVPVLVPQILNCILLLLLARDLVDVICVESK